MSDTPYMELGMAVGGELWWLDPFNSRHQRRRKKKMHAVTLRLTDAQLAQYKAMGGALGMRKLLDSASSDERSAAPTPLTGATKSNVPDPAPSLEGVRNA